MGFICYASAGHAELISDFLSDVSCVDSGKDVLVFLHIQKTGGTFFGKNLVKNLDLKVPCHCEKGEGMLRCPCMSSDNRR